MSESIERSWGFCICAGGTCCRNPDNRDGGHACRRKPRVHYADALRDVLARISVVAVSRDYRRIDDQ